MRCPRVFIILIGLFLSSPACADDWPGWMGPGRDNIWREDGLLKSFPEGGPTILWRTPVHGGYSGPAVADGRVYITDFLPDEDAPPRGRIPGLERVVCLDMKTGEITWTHDYPVVYTIAYPAGPRCTPLVHQGIVYTLGAMGDLFALEAKTGGVIWHKDLTEAYDTSPPRWGYAAHPLIDGNKLITLAGGQGTQVVALNRKSGEEIWRALSTPETGQGYSPPSLIKAGGVRQLIIAQPDALSSLNPRTGEVYWSEPYISDNGTTIMTPVHLGDYLYMGSFTRRNLLIKLSDEKPAAETVWLDKPQHGLSAINAQPLADVEEPIIYGVDQTGRTTAIQIPSGDRLWETPAPTDNRPAPNATSFFVRQGDSDRYWMFTEDGDLVIARMTPEGFKELDRAHVIEPTNIAFGREVVWSPPAYAGRSVVVRNGEEIIRVDLSAARE